MEEKPRSPSENEREAAGSSNDVHDTSEELKRYGEHLRNALTYFKETVGRSFADYDRVATSKQRWHRLIVSVFCVSGSLAVVFAILHITRLLPPQDNPDLTRYLAIALFWGELVCVVAAGFSAIVGSVWAFQKNWLVTRHKAESIRLLKFGSLIKSALLAGNDEQFEGWKADLCDRLARINMIDLESVEEWIEEAWIPDQPALSSSTKIDDRTVKDLIEYFEKKRLSPQSKYFYNRAQRNLRWDWSTRLLPPVLFFASVLFAVLHLIHEVFEFRSQGSEHYFNNWTREVNGWSILFIVLAACLPVLAACIRGLRSAYEFSRNTLRLKANHFALELFRDRLRQETDADAVLNSLRWSELMLEAEHREWLRLMIEAEWIG
jgi:hypothetical protein